MFPATVCSKYSRISKQALRSRQLTPQTPTSPRAASRRVSHKFCCPAANILPRQAEMTFSYSSPTFTQTLLGGDAGRGSPRSPRLSFRASVHALTLVCTAAFAAISTAFVCIFVLTSRQNENEGHHMPLHFSHERGNDNSVSLRSEGGPKRLEFPVEESIGMADVDSSFVKLGRRSILPRTQRDAAKIVVNDPSTWPTAAVWLMSFPNSGTSYTLHTVRELTNTTTATNYGLEGDIKDEDSAPAFKGDIGVNGPYLELIRGRTTTIPELILTKTHCGGYSYSLNPDSYIVNPRKFFRECLFSLKGVRSNDTMARQPVWYSPDLVKKVVHIVRDPYDNVVARFHLDRYAKTESWLKEYPANKLGFQKWCNGIDDDNNRLMSHTIVDNDLRKAFSGVPCRAEFFRYVQWHNMAFTVTSDLGLPELVFHYESYSTSFATTIEDLLDFLELSPIGEPEVFIPGKVYGDYYSEDEKLAIEGFAKEFSSKTTWSYLSHYFEGNQ